MLLGHCVQKRWKERERRGVGESWEMGNGDATRDGAQGWVVEMFRRVTLGGGGAMGQEYDLTLGLRLGQRGGLCVPFTRLRRPRPVPSSGGLSPGRLRVSWRPQSLHC